jgi:hypothetical protein
MELNEIDMYGSLKSLMNYLKTEVEVIPGEVERKEHLRVIGTVPGYIIKIKVSNTAPVGTTWPMIVFTGINLVTDTSPGTQAWMNHHHFKVDALKSYPQAQPSISSESFSRFQPLKLGSPAFPILTPDEMAHGYSLFPGQYVVYEIGRKGEDMPNLKELNFWVEGSLSRRHLFHSMKQII